MSRRGAMPLRFVLPLPGFVLRPLTAVVIAAVHVYLAFGHLSHLFGGEVRWEHIWKGFGALAGAYVFAALASRGLAENRPSVVAGAARGTLFLTVSAHSSKER